MQDDITRQQAAQDDTQRAAQVHSAEPAAEELGDEALENVAGGCQWGSSSTSNELPPWIIPTIPDAQ